MVRLRDSQLKTVLRCIAEIYGLRDPATFPQEMLTLVTSAIPSEPGYNEFTRRGAITLSVRRQPLPDAMMQYLYQLGPKLFQVHPILKHIVTTASPEPFRLSDRIGLAEWRRCALYNECYAAVKCDYQMGFVWRAGQLRFALPMNRSKRDFSDEEKQMLSLLRPHLVQAHANAWEFARLSRAVETLRGAVLLVTRRGRIQHATAKAQKWLAEYFGLPRDRAVLPPTLVAWLTNMTATLPRLPFVQRRNGNRLTIWAIPPFAESITLVLEERRAPTPVDLRTLGLSAREAEVLFWLSQAKTNYEIGVILGVTTHTVRKHVEHVLKKLKVENRAAATAIARDIPTDASSCIGRNLSP